jgi:hypothetical protein
MLHRSHDLEGFFGKRPKVWKMETLEKQGGVGCMDWIVLAQNRDQWRALLNTVMNHRVPLNVGKFMSG